MKFYIYLISILLFLAFITNANADVMANKTIKFKCDEMTCSGCKSKITKSLKELKGIKNINIDLDTKIVVVTYNDKKTNPEAIKNAIAEAGYEALLIE